MASRDTYTGRGASIVSKGGEVAKEAKEAAAPWVEGLARFGYVAKGVVYVVVGGLAALAALHVGRGGTTGKAGALQMILGQPYGKVMLAIVAAGLTGFVLWRFTQAFLDADRKGADAKGLAIRAFYVGSGLVYASLAYAAARLVLGSGGGGDDSYGDWTAKLMGQPFGRWLVALAGLAVIGVGAYQGYRAWTAKFRKRLKSGEMSRDEDVWLTRMGRVGFVARGIVFGTIGAFFVQAAIRHNPARARGMEGALDALQGQPYGRYVMGAVAVGLVMYGLFQFVYARYRRIEVD